MSEVEALFGSRQVAFAFHRRRLRFDLARSVFSSAGVDPGSALLLRHLQASTLQGGERVLDLGCGHGTLGIVLQALDHERRIVSVDRDALACRYTTRNVTLNQLPAADHEVVPSLGYDDVDRHEPFDLIVSNIPGKVGDRVIEHFVDAAPWMGRPGTILGLVVVEPLTALLTAAVDRAGFEPVVRRGNRTHTVLIATQPASPTGETPLPGFERGVYDRASSRFAVGEQTWSARTVVGIDEFDTLAHPTRLLRRALQGVPASPSIVINPGQGHRAVIAAGAGYEPRMLLDRDLLALRASRRCLLDAGRAAPALVHDVTLDVPLPDDVRLIIAHAGDKAIGPWFADLVGRCLDRLGSGGDLVLTGRAGLLGRIEADLLDRCRGHVAHKESQRGFRALRFRR